MNYDTKDTCVLDQDWTDHSPIEKRKERWSI